MKAIVTLLIVSLKLNFRNRMALIYGYLFPLIFLVAFWGIYRYDKVPLALHMGQLLTVTILGGACFGLPTTLVSERERGVWRRYRLSPVPTWAFVASSLLSRYFLLLTAAMLQLAFAMAIGMPLPNHPLGLLLAFTIASIAFLGLGIEIAMLANSVPAVQALGQCIFLPMLMVGGVAVRLSSLPAWALHLSAFLPGRYAVEILQACVTGHGFHRTGFDVLALLLIGGAGAVAAAAMFRWESNKRVSVPHSKLWLLLAFAMWATVGVLAEAEGRIANTTADAEDVRPPSDYLAKARPPLPTATPQPAAPAAAPLAGTAPSAVGLSTPTASRAAVPTPPPSDFPHMPSSWQAVTEQDIDQIDFARLPPDEDVVAPIAGSQEQPEDAVADQLAHIRAALNDWPPGKISDPVQRARNDLYVAAVPDVLEMDPLERFVPALVFERLRQDIPAQDLPRILYWIAMHPDAGEDSAIRQLEPLGLPSVSGPSRTPRSRVMLYAFKLLGRLNGKIAPK
jgi:hypothetical protein